MSQIKRAAKMKTMSSAPPSEDEAWSHKNWCDVTPHAVSIRRLVSSFAPHVPVIPARAYLSRRGVQCVGACVQLFVWRTSSLNDLVNSCDVPNAHCVLHVMCGSVQNDAADE